MVVKTLALLGCNFDCASRNEIRLVLKACEDMPRKPDIIYANPCKARGHLIEAVCKGVRMVTFDNVTEVAKCAAISKDIQLILRIITDDRGSQCRLSSKFGAPRHKWRPLLAAAAQHGLQVVGVSFHVGSGCRDATRYELALKDAREIFDIAKADYGMNMHILDIGGGFPGETHSIWNPAELDEEDDEVDEGKPASNDGSDKDEEEEGNRFMFFNEIAEQVAPVIDELFEPEVRVIGEPGRYFVAASATLCCSVVSARTNEVDDSFKPDPVDDEKAAMALAERPADGPLEAARKRSTSVASVGEDPILSTIQEELVDYSSLFASQHLAGQKFDVYNDNVDYVKDGLSCAADLLGPPRDEHYDLAFHSVEGMPSSFAYLGEENEDSAMLTLAAAGEAAVNGMVIQAVADSGPLQDDFAYYINDGVYGAFNNIMFDHASVRPRVLSALSNVKVIENDGFMSLDTSAVVEGDVTQPELFASTVFGPTCDSIDVIARSVLLPKLKIGDWLYFNNMGAYTMAAASSFNGFVPSDRFYVCSVLPEYFETLIEGPDVTFKEEKKDDA